VDEWPGDVSLEGVEDLRSSESLEQAAAEFDARAGRMAEVLRAARVARLELDGAYEPERHDRALDRFDWRTARREELRLFPQVAVLEHAEGVRRKGMGALFDLLLSGRPVHALLLERPLLQRAEELARPHLDLGYLAAAQHVAFVLQSTLAQPEHVDAGFAAMARTPLPAVALVAAPTGEGETPAPVELAVAHEARATPCFRYDPESGESWADCFELGPNPQTERIWPVHELRYADEAGSEATREESFTYAHAAAMDSSFGCHFRCLAPAEWDDSQIEIAEYLALDEAGRSHKLPFVWTVDEDRRLTRTVLTHELAETCRDRMNRWRTFRELAGVESRHALRAAEQARLDAEARAEEAAREAATKHEEELERVRETAGQEALERLVNVLMDLESAPGSAPALTSERAAALVAEAATAPGAETAEVPAVSEEAPPEQPAEEEEGLSFDEPYIDSVLCTTCNECINLNSRLFTYNENKQATIGDPSAGTFDELVKAAEKCPARCIHPGKPRDDDPTVTDALRARAAKFD
jgi:ferredoxin